MVLARNDFFNGLLGLPDSSLSASIGGLLAPALFMDKVTAMDAANDSVDPRPVPARPIPEGFSTITPHLSIRNCHEALEFYKAAFGAEERLGVSAMKSIAVVIAVLLWLSGGFVVLDSLFFQPAINVDKLISGGSALGLGTSAGFLVLFLRQREEEKEGEEYYEEDYDDDSG